MTNPTPLDITNIPYLRHVVEELRTTKQPRLLKQDSKPVALLMPLGDSDQPEDIWKDYDPKQVQQALATSAGILIDIDRTQLLADIRKERVQERHRIF